MPASPSRRVVAAIIERDGEILICQRRRGDSHALKWEFPGGKVERGESLQEALERELEEELAIQARIGPQLARSTHQYPGRAPMELIFFSVREFHGVPVNRAFEQFRWEKPARLPEYDFLEADAAILRTLAE
jgi:8-oxo-dGTP diphosphatase